MIDLSLILQGVTLAVVLWCLRALVNVRERVARIEGVLHNRRLKDEE